MSQKNGTSKIDSPVNLDNAAISKIMLPAQAVHVSLDTSKETPFIPCFKFICRKYINEYLLNVSDIHTFLLHYDKSKFYYSSIWYPCSCVKCR